MIHMVGKHAWVDTIAVLWSLVRILLLLLLMRLSLLPWVLLGHDAARYRICSPATTTAGTRARALTR